MNKPETAIVNKIMKYLQALPGCCVEKRHGTNYGKAGQPDLSVCYLGRRFEIEVKVPRDNLKPGDAAAALRPVFLEQIAAMMHKETRRLGSMPTELQLERLREWENAGAVCCVVYSLEAVRALLGAAAAIDLTGVNRGAGGCVGARVAFDALGDAMPRIDNAAAVRSSSAAETARNEGVYETT